MAILVAKAYYKSLWKSSSKVIFTQIEYGAYPTTIYKEFRCPATENWLNDNETYLWLPMHNTVKIGGAES